jgi:hypothetical protein
LQTFCEPKGQKWTLETSKIVHILASMVVQKKIHCSWIININKKPNYYIQKINCGKRNNIILKGIWISSTITIRIRDKYDLLITNIIIYTQFEFHQNLQHLQQYWILW